METSIPLPAPGGDPQSFGSVVTYLRRYAVTALLGIASDEDDDGNRAAGNRMKDVTPRHERLRDEAGRTIDPVQALTIRAKGARDVDDGTDLLARLGERDRGYGGDPRPAGVGGAGAACGRRLAEQPRPDVRLGLRARGADGGARGRGGLRGGLGRRMGAHAHDDAGGGAGNLSGAPGPCGVADPAGAAGRGCGGGGCRRRAARGRGGRRGGAGRRGRGCPTLGRLAGARSPRAGRGARRAARGRRRRRPEGSASGGRSPCSSRGRRCRVLRLAASARAGGRDRTPSGSRLTRPVGRCDGASRRTASPGSGAAPDCPRACAAAALPLLRQSLARQHRALPDDDRAGGGHERDADQEPDGRRRRSRAGKGGEVRQGGRPGRRQGDERGCRQGSADHGSRVHGGGAAAAPFRSKLRGLGRSDERRPWIGAIRAVDEVALPLLAARCRR